MPETFDLVSYLVTVCPALGILAWVVIHFKGQLKDRDERIKELTDELVEISRDQIKVNTEVKTVLDIIKNK